MMEDGGLGQGGYRMEAVTDGSATGYWAVSGNGEGAVAAGYAESLSNNANKCSTSQVDDITAAITRVMMFKNFAQLLHASKGTESIIASRRRSVAIDFNWISVW